MLLQTRGGEQSKGVVRAAKGTERDASARRRDADPDKTFSKIAASQTSRHAALSLKLVLCAAASSMWRWQFVPFRSVSITVQRSI